MRVMFLCDNFPPEGNAPAARTFEHAVRWVRAGHDVTVITCAPNFPEGRLFAGYSNDWRKVEFIGGVRVVRVKTYISPNEGVLKRTLDYVSFMVMAVIVGLFERRPDVVVATSPQFFCAVGGWALAVAKRRPFVFELRDLWPASIAAVGAMRNGFFIKLLERLEMFLYRQAAMIIPVTEAFRSDLMARGIPGEKIHVVLNGVDLDRYSPTSRDEALAREYGLEGKFVVGYMGTHGLAHALPKVLEAAEHLRHRKDIAFFFAGSGAERATVESIVTDRCLDNVRLIPRQPKERMPALWSLCDLALVPLRDELVFRTVIPSKLFESMGMGVPILMSLPEGEATEIVRSTGAGVCVQPESPRAMADEIVRLASSRTEMEELRRRCLLAAPNYSRDRFARRMIVVLEKVAGGSSAMD